MAKIPDQEARQLRLIIQKHFWSQVGSQEHINMPKLEDAIRREFHANNDRLVKAQVRLMQSEGRIRIREKAKVWVKQPEDL